MSAESDPTEVPLVVILGAGASVGAADYWGEESPPPLTIDLFDERLYGELLADYDLAHQAGRYLERERNRDDTLSLERGLHDLRVSKHEHHRRMAYALPPYLQHLLHKVSDEHYRHAYRYDQLIERLLRLPHVCFMTLNYDVMLDRRLAAHHPLGDFEDYISEEKNWSLIKLHGSVNWFFEEPNYLPNQPPAAELDLRDEWLRSMPLSASLQEIRGDGVGRYPALALPEGPEDRLVVPARHLNWARERLSAPPNIDLLVIGYSGLDREALGLVKEAGTQVRLMTIVNRDLESAIDVRERFRDAGIESVWTETAHGRFGSWVDDGGLDGLVEQFGGPYENAH